MKFSILLLTFQQSLRELLAKSDQDKLEERDSQTQIIRGWEEDGVVYIFLGNSNGTLTLDAMKKESWGFERAGLSRSKEVIFTTGRNFKVSVISFCNPGKHQRIRGFRVLSGDIERDQWCEIL